MFNLLLPSLRLPLQPLHLSFPLSSAVKYVTGDKGTATVYEAMVKVGWTVAKILKRDGNGNGNLQKSKDLLSYNPYVLYSYIHCLVKYFQRRL